jgi:uncharacterized membrane protein
MTALPLLPGAVGGIGNAISADGVLIAGTGFGAFSSIEAFAYDDGTATVTGLGQAAGTTYSQSFGITTDGAVIVGGGFYIGAEDVPFRYSVGSILALPPFPGGDALGGGANDVSADGFVVVGTVGNILPSDAFIWDAGLGM